MSDTEAVDRLLRRSFTAQPPPTLSPDFELRITKRLKPQRLSSKSRSFLMGYSLVGIALSFWALLASGMAWWLALFAICLPLVIVGAILRPLLVQIFKRPS